MMPPITSKESGVYILGDIHGEWGHLNAFINKKRPGILLQCGDFGYWPRFSGTTALSKKIYSTSGEIVRQKWYLEDIKNKNTKIHFCDGNHEDHWSLNALKNREILPGVHHMPRGSTLVLPDGRRVLFMGGARSIDQQFRTMGVDWFPEETISEKDFANLPDEEVDIVISHTCPLEFYKSIKGDFKLAKFSDPCYAALSEILYRYKPSLWFFAHFHYTSTGMYKNTRWELLNTAGESGWWRQLPPRK